MTSYRETMNQTLEFMRIMHEYKILERTLTDTEQKRREEIAQDMDDSEFKDRYGDRWKEVKMAVATKQAKKEAYDDDEEDETGDPDDQYDDEEERQQTEGKELDEGTIDKVKEIASKKAAAKIDGVLVDMFTASAISQIYDKVNDVNKKKMEKLPITKLANLAFKMMQKNEFVPEEVELDEEWKVGDKAFYMGKRVKITKVWPKGGYQIDGKTNVSGNELSIKEQWEKKLKKIRGNTAGAEGQRAAIEDDIAREKEKKNPDKKLIESDLDEGKFQVKTAATKKGKITVTDFDNLKDAKKHLASMEKKGQRGIISKDGKPVKEVVDLGEVKVRGTNVGGIGVKGKGLPGSSARYKLPKGRPRGAPHIENERFWDLPKSQLDYIRKDAYDAMKANPTARKASGKWADEVNDAETVLYWRKKKGIKEEVELDEAKDIDPKTAKIIAKMIARGKFDYGFDYGLSRNNIDDIKKQGGKPPRGVGPDGGGHLEHLLKALGADNIYLDGPDLVDGDKTIGKWKGMSIGDVFKKARVRYEEVGLNERPYSVTNPDLGVWKGDARSDADAAEKAMRKWGVRKGAASSRMFMKKTKVKKEYDFLDHLEIDEGKMSQLHQLIKDKKTPEEIAKIMKLDVKTIKALMDDFNEKYTTSQRAAREKHRTSVDSVTGERGRKGDYGHSGAGFLTGPGKKRGVKKVKEAIDPADIDIDATADDIKAADKNIIMQMRKAQSMRGKFAVEFGDKKKVKIPAKIAIAVQQKFNSFRKPVDKEKFQARVAKSYKDMLSALKESNNQPNTILNRIAIKIQERKDG